MKSVSDDRELRRAEDEHKRKLLEIESECGPRGSEAEGQVKKRSQDDQSDQGMDHKTEGERENVSCLCGEASTRRDTSKRR